MKKICLILAIMSLTSCMIGSGENSSIEANNNKFPLMSGINLDGIKHELPKDFAGELNLVSIGFEREHQEAINTWIKVANEYKVDRFILYKHTSTQIYYTEKYLAMRS